jgi:tRNA-specific 2-thiouridylase
MRCNERIKFAAVLDRALALGFDAVVTGHYARLVDGSLRRAADAAKDQSYVLGVLTRDQLRRAMLPLGDSSKAQVRAEAAARGLAVAAKPDSQDICFIPDGDAGGFLRRRLGEAVGQIVDADTGAVLGEHRGSHAFTVGQRRGLRLERPAPDGRPRYVVSVQPRTNTVVVGPIERLAVGEVIGERPVWNGPIAPAVDDERAIECAVQLRAHGPSSPATARLRAGRLVARLRTPQHGIAPGQTMVLYGGPDADTVLGSATIAQTGLAAMGDPLDPVVSMP